MKSEKGVAITSIMIYIIALTVVVILIGRIITYFYKNINNVEENTLANAEYLMFNSYFTDEINIEGNEVETCESNYIIFSQTQNQYTYQNGSIYRGKVKIAKDIEFCEFYYNEDTKEIYVNMKIQDKYYSSTFTVAK